MYAEQATLSPIDPTRNSLTERLKIQKEQNEKRLAEVNELLSLLEKNPQLQEVLDKLSKYGLY